MLVPAPTKCSKTSPTPVLRSSLADGQDASATFGREDANNVLRLLSHDDLKGLFTVLLEDPQSGPVANKLLKTRAHAYGRTRARIICDSVSRQVFDKREQLEIDGDRLNGLQGAGEYPDAMEVLMRKIETLIDLGTAINGPELAWMALLNIAIAALSPGLSGEIAVDGYKEDNDSFHEQVDIYMLTICKAHALSGDKSWLKSRRAELLVLRD